MIKTVGFIGLGRMGKWMAANILKAGFDLTVYDVKDQAAGFLTDQGAESVRTPGILAESVDCVVLCLPGVQAIETVMYAEDGVMAGLEPGKRVIDCGTSDFHWTLDFAAALSKHGIRFVDAPVTGMEKRARDGTLSIMCGGEKPDVDAIRPLLAAVGNRLVHMGAAGGGQLTKLINQMLFNGNMAVIAEVLPMAVKLGLDPGKTTEIINTGSGRSFASEFFIPNILKREFGKGYHLNDAYKDMQSAVKIAAKNQIPLPMVQTAMATYQMALASGFGGEDKGAMVKVFESLLGVQCRSKDQ